MVITTLYCSIKWWKLKERRATTRRLKEVREGLGLGVRQFAGEAGVSTRTLQDTEGGKTPRPQTAKKYADALRQRGVDPNEVQEIRDALGEVFHVDLTPETTMMFAAMDAWSELTRGFVNAGEGEWLEAELRRIRDEEGGRNVGDE
ncbi:MAG: helix-turn-helix transcriptional regulator [Actinomycetota bacterium]|nr:helix-turn-helix transcriptional regulator [Actinomycetota bacterium]